MWIDGNNLNIPLEITDFDDIGFTHIVNTISLNIIRSYTPYDYYIVKIDNWFDQKWFLFEGKALGAISVHRHDPFVVPPFHPNRVEQQLYFLQSGNREYCETEKNPLHIEQSSDKNIGRKLFSHGESSFALWWSGNTKGNKQGALMMYRQTDKAFSNTVASKDFWFVSFVKNDVWKINKTEFISPQIIENLMVDHE